MGTCECNETEACTACVQFTTAELAAISASDDVELIREAATVVFGYEDDIDYNPAAAEKAPWPSKLLEPVEAIPRSAVLPIARYGEDSFGYSLPWGRLPPRGNR